MQPRPNSNYSRLNDQNHSYYDNNRSNDGPEIPERFLCPISHEVMDDPVLVVGAGNIYDRKSIETWFEDSDIDPLSRQKVSKQLERVNNLRSEIMEYRTNHSYPYTATQLANMVINYALNGCPADEELGEDLIRAVRIDGYLNPEKRDTIFCHLVEQFKSYPIHNQPADVQEIVARALAKQLQTYFKADNSAKKHYSFKSNRAFKGHSPFISQGASLVSHVHTTIPLDKLGDVIRDEIENILYKLSSPQSFNAL